MTQDTNTLNSEINKTQGSAHSGKYLTFQLDNTEFAIEILKVVEILKMMDITSVPMWPSFAKGTINLRGRVIPVIDLRQKFGLSEAEDTERTCTIVVELGGDQVGIQVEEVNEVREISQDNVSPPPSIGGTVNSDFILGMGKANGSTIILLNLEKILIGSDMDLLLGTEMEVEDVLTV